MEEDPHKMLTLNFTQPTDEFRGVFNTKGGARSMTASIIKNGGWFRHYGFKGLNTIPEVPVDEDVISPEEIKIYGDFLKTNGFFGPNSWYVKVKPMISMQKS